MSRQLENHSRTILDASLRHSLVAVLIDSSPSMETSVEPANRALKAFNDGLSSIPEVSKILEVAFGEYDEGYRLVQPFTPVCELEGSRLIHPGGCGTRADIAIPAFLNDIQSYKHDVLAANAISYNRAIVLHITDGFSQGDLADVAQLVKRLESRKSLSFFTLAMPGASLSQIASYTQPERILDLTEEVDLEKSLSKVMSSFAVLSCSSAASNSGSFASGGATAGSEAATAASILSAFSLADKG